jgi:hypothetical protein
MKRIIPFLKSDQFEFWARKPKRVRSAQSFQFETQTQKVDSGKGKTKKTS